MKLSIGQASDAGPRKGANQDSILAATFEDQPQVILLIVADGMGGAKAGEIASQEAVKGIYNYLLETIPLDVETVPTHLHDAIAAANAAVFAKSKSSPEFEGMGSTVVSMLIMDDTYWIASVGDSRAYLIRDEQCHQLTTDHTWVNARVQEGLLTPEQAAQHSLSHVLDRALGVEETVKIDMALDDILEEGDALVLCSDGLHSVLEERVIVQIASSYNGPEAAQILLEQALEAPAEDNTSVIVVRAGDLV